MKGHFVQRKKWIKKFIKSYWSETPNTLAKLQLEPTTQATVQNPHKLSQNKTIPNNIWCQNPKSFPRFFSSQNLMWWTKWEFTCYTPKTKPLVMPLHCSICYAYPHSKIFVFLASWSPCCLVTIFIALLLHYFFCHLHLLCHFTISIMSIVLTDVFWFKKKKLPSYQVREEDLARIWLVNLWCKLLGADNRNFL